MRFKLRPLPIICIPPPSYEAPQAVNHLLRDPEVQQPFRLPPLPGRPPACPLSSPSTPAVASTAPPSPSPEVARPGTSARAASPDTPRGCRFGGRCDTPCRSTTSPSGALSLARPRPRNERRRRLAVEASRRGKPRGRRRRSCSGSSAQSRRRGRIFGGDLLEALGEDDVGEDFGIGEGELVAEVLAEEVERVRVKNGVGLVERLFAPNLERRKTGHLGNISTLVREEGRGVPTSRSALTGACEIARALPSAGSHIVHRPSWRAPSAPDSSQIPRRLKRTPRFVSPTPPPVPPPATSFPDSHIFRCLDQSATWHFRLQYRVNPLLHLEQNSNFSFGTESSHRGAHVSVPAFFVRDRKHAQCKSHVRHTCPVMCSTLLEPLPSSVQDTLRAAAGSAYARALEGGSSSPLTFGGHGKSRTLVGRA